MLFLSTMYVAYVLLSRTKIRIRIIWKNYWIWILSLVFVLADRSLFIANGIAQSKVTVMTLIKQSGVLVSIVGGKLFFHEQKIAYKLLCAGVILSGIVIAVL
jgi:drug/metabolite transporter (DMT)-like permease